MSQFLIYEIDQMIQLYIPSEFGILYYSVLL